MGHTELVRARANGTGSEGFLQLRLLQPTVLLVSCRFLLRPLGRLREDLGALEKLVDAIRATPP